MASRGGDAGQERVTTPPAKAGGFVPTKYRILIVWEFAFFLMEMQTVSPDRELWRRTQTIPSSSPPAGRFVLDRSSRYSTVGHAENKAISLPHWRQRHRPDSTR